MGKAFYYVALGDEMQRLDAYIMQEFGLLPEILMERAGLGCAKAIKSYFPPSLYTKVLFLCGPGNNGGDGFVCARYLWDWGYKIEVLLCSEKEKYTREAKRNLELLEKLNVPLRTIKSFEDLEDFFKYFQPQLIVDALFGTGLKRPLSGFYEELLLFIREKQKSNSFKIVAIDIPSGISANNGQILGIALSADLTITFECFKAGHLIYPGKEFSGEIKIVDIGYPWRLIKELGLPPR